MKLCSGLVEDLFTFDLGAHVGGDTVIELGLALDRLEHGVLTAQLEQSFLEHLLGKLALRLGDRNALIVAELHHRRQWDRGSERDRFPAGDFDARLRDRIKFFLFQRLSQGLRDEPLGRFLEHGIGAERVLDHAPGRFALAEAGDAEAL